ncbi:MAG: hypothetical protein CFH01_01544 [Alphaproteobacteria bacterium MarineAlpha2_Bin1]|nr:MAG: hypothetical protein CFH01_01544 [Alphaproteobacteria bacterium MarineAlpha2_Bin1]
MEKKIYLDVANQDKKALIEEALKIRAEACETLGSDIIASLYNIVTGKKVDIEKLE